MRVLSVETFEDGYEEMKMWKFVEAYHQTGTAAVFIRNLHLISQRPHKRGVSIPQPMLKKIPLA